MPRLFVLSGALLGRVFEFEGEAVVGRVPAADVTLDDGSVSRRHARIHEESDGVWHVEDAGSSNGTFVGGERVESAPLEDGEVFRLGAVELRFRADAPPAAGADIQEPRGEDDERTGADVGSSPAEDEPGEGEDELELEFGDDLDEALADTPRPSTPTAGPAGRAVASGAPRSRQGGSFAKSERSAGAPRRTSGGARAARDAQARRAQALGGAVRPAPVSDGDGGRPVLQYARTRSGGTDVGQFGWAGRLLVALLGLAVFAGALWAAFALTNGGS
ncbi:MAG: FHA domain-containing protein [Planctomycetota bacterium]